MAVTDTIDKHLAQHAAEIEKILFIWVDNYPPERRGRLAFQQVVEATKLLKSAVPNLRLTDEQTTEIPDLEL